MARKTERVVVTGMSVASPLGCDLANFWEGLLKGRSGVRSLEDGEFSGLSTRIGGVVWDYDESKHFEGKEARRMSRSSQFAIVATQQAITEANLSDGQVDYREVGIMIGSSIGGYSASDQFFKSFYTRGRLSPFTIPISMNSGPGSNVSIKYGFQGPLLNVDAACATAAHSIGHAFNWIRSGSLQVAVTGATDMYGLRSATPCKTSPIACDGWWMKFIPKPMLFGSSWTT